MSLVEKKWWWKLSFPFAHNNYTTIGDNLYYPKGRVPSARIIDHEEIHSRHMVAIGLAKFIFLYLFCLPFFWNPLRWKTEYEAYTLGSKFTDQEARRILRSWQYGWLLNGGSK